MVLLRNGQRERPLQMLQMHQLRQRSGEGLQGALGNRQSCSSDQSQEVVQEARRGLPGVHVDAVLVHELDDLYAAVNGPEQRQVGASIDVVGVCSCSEQRFTALVAPPAQSGRRCLRPVLTHDVR